jgi:hypothetical protein
MSHPSLVSRSLRRSASVLVLTAAFGQTVAHDISVREVPFHVRAAFRSVQEIILANPVPAAIIGGIAILFAWVMLRSMA